jgi:agmatine deiminase
MPVQVGHRDFVKFRYEPGYLQDCEWLTTDAATCCSVPHLRNLCLSNINLDGGNIVGTGTRAILTEKVFRENRQRGRQELELELERLLRAQCVFIPQEPGDEIGHADGVVQVLDQQTVVIHDHRNVNPNYGERLAALLRRHGFRVKELPYFCTDEVVDGIPSAVGNYVNFLRVEGLIVVPAYGVPEDEIAARKLESLLPDTRIVPLRCERLARKGGVLNCVSWTIRT